MYKTGTADVNSLHPSMIYSQLKCTLPLQKHVLAKLFLNSLYGKQIQRN